jgi:hypothetical protein
MSTLAKVAVTVRVTMTVELDDNEDIDEFIDPEQIIDHLSGWGGELTMRSEADWGKEAEVISIEKLQNE